MGDEMLEKGTAGRRGSTPTNSRSSSLWPAACLVSAAAQSTTRTREKMYAVRPWGQTDITHLDLIFSGPNGYPIGTKTEVRSSGPTGQTGPRTS
jgi:hypothetical protein